MYRDSWEPRKCHVSMELQVLGRQKIDRTPLLLGMPSCLSSYWCMLMITCTYRCACACKQVRMHAHSCSQAVLSPCVLKLSPTSSILTFLPLRKRLQQPSRHHPTHHPALYRCVTLLPHSTLPRSLVMHADPSEQRGLKQERQPLSIRLACSQCHMLLLAHVTICLEVPVEVH